MKSKIYLIRHGLTEGNEKRWFYGSTDLHVLEKGKEELRKLADKGIYPKVGDDAYFVTTGLVRTSETLETIFGKREYEAQPLLREMAFGEYECVTYDELKSYEHFEEWAYDKSGDVSLPGAESRNDFAKRCIEGFGKVLEGHKARQRDKESETVVVAHGGVISIIINHIFGKEGSTIWDFMPELGMGYEIEIEEGVPVSMKRIEDSKKLGFGLMRPPMLDEETIDIEQVKKMVDEFMARGFNYFDTAWGYLDGKSEEMARAAIVERYPRNKFKLATKLPAFMAKTKEDAEAMFYNSLERTAAGFFDYYLLHNLGNERTAKYEEFGIWEFLKDRKAEGKIVKLGFSFHGKASELEEIMKAHSTDVDFVQLQINYADWDSPSVESAKCYEVVRSYDKPIIVMEPIKGGSLARLPENLESIFKEINPNASISSWALRYAAGLIGVERVLSGMSSLEQMEDNLKTMDGFIPLSPEELDSVKKVAKGLHKLTSVPCTACGYCLKGCPKQIAIPGVFRAVNNLEVFNNKAGARGNFAWETRHGGLPSKCIKCGRCEAVCPQHIEIIKELERAASIFEK